MRTQTCIPINKIDHYSSLATTFFVYLTNTNSPYILAPGTILNALQIETHLFLLTTL